MTKKKITVVFLLIFFFFGCTNGKLNQNDDGERFYLNDNYYNNGEFIKITSDDFSRYENDSYILYIYNNYCSLSIPCEDIFKSFMQKYDIAFLSMPFREFKEISLYEEVRYAPSIIVVQNGKVKSYLDANQDNDLIKYQDVKAFEEWLNEYVYFTKKN